MKRCLSFVTCKISGYLKINSKKDNTTITKYAFL